MPRESRKLRQLRIKFVAIKTRLRKPNASLATRISLIPRLAIAFNQYESLRLSEKNRIAPS